MLVTTNIVNSRTSQTYQAFTTYISYDFTSDPTLPITMSPSEYVNKCWERYQTSCPNKNNNLNGKVFEVIIATELYRENIRPFYLQAKVTFVPNVNYDIVLYNSANNSPIVLSVKTCARERYKQADLEAVALKYVHRKAYSYLVMDDSHEAINLKNKIISGDILGIDEIVDAGGKDIDAMFTRLRAYTLGIPKQVEVIDGTVVK